MLPGGILAQAQPFRGVPGAFALSTFTSLLQRRTTFLSFRISSRSILATATARAKHVAQKQLGRLSRRREVCGVRLAPQRSGG
jgi:hypothetical protein